MSSITLGVAALVAIDAFAANVTDSVRDQSRAILGGDLSFTSRGPFPAPAAAVLDSLTRAGARSVRVTSFASMAVARSTGQTRLVQVRAVGPAYPLVGAVTTLPATAWARVADTLRDGIGGAVVDPALLVTLATHVGDTISLGYARFVIAGTLQGVPGDAGLATAMGPRVFIAEHELDATRLLTFGSRAEYKTLLTLPGSGSPALAATRLRARLDSVHVRLQTATESDTNLTGAIGRLRDFLRIVGLVALLLGGIGVASGIHAFVLRKVDTVAVLRCLGATSRQVLAIYLLQAAAMALVGALAGAALGLAVQFGLPAAVNGLLPVDVTPQFAPGPVASGVAIGLWVAILFALRPLLELRRVSPLQALRQSTSDTAPTTSRAARLIDLALAASIALLCVVRAPSHRLGLGIAVAISLVLAALWLSATALSALARRLVRIASPRDARRLALPYVVRQGVANLYRPANQTRAVVLSLGFGAFLISTLALVQSNLLAELGTGAAASHGNLLFFDIQQDQGAGVDSAIRNAHQSIIERAPLVTMRIAAIGHADGHSDGHTTARDDRPTDGRAGGGASDSGTTPSGRRGAGWALRREYRSTYRDTLVASEHLVAGQFSAAPAAGALPGLSLEADLARELGVVLGDTITWDVQGVRIPTRLTSLRTIDWARFEPNFFAVFPTGVLEQAPQQAVVLANAPNADTLAQLQRTIVDRYPNVSSVDLTLIRQTVEGVLHKVTLAIRFMALFSIALALPVLASAVSATRRERVREGVLLKTLGASRAQILRIMSAEYATLGLLGSLTGMVLSFAGAWGLMRFAFDASFRPAPGPAVAIAAATAALTLAIGLIGGRDVFTRTPAAALGDA
jgi:putative ABC transport system permease protein